MSSLLYVHLLNTTDIQTLLSEKITCITKFTKYTMKSTTDSKKFVLHTDMTNQSHRRQDDLTHR